MLRNNLIIRRFSQLISDICIIGGGPAGISASLRSAEYGLKTILINNNNRIGGAVLNDGVISSKILLKGGELLEKSNNLLHRYGIYPHKKFKMDIKKLMITKTQILNNLNEHILRKLKNNNVSCIKGNASFIDSNTIMINNDKNNTIKSKKFILATGTRIKNLGTIKFDEKQILSSNGILNIKKIPKNLFIVGGGVLGIEIANAFQSFGSKVSIIEMDSKILSNLDYELREIYEKHLIEKNYKLYLNQKLINAYYLPSKKRCLRKVQLITQNLSNKEIKCYKSDYLLICNDRKPNTDKLNLDNINVKLDKNGKIIVDDNYKSTNPNIYAIGDIIPGITLSNTAICDGINVIDLICNKNFPIKRNQEPFPSAIYTNPEIGTIGYTEQYLIEKNIKYNKVILNYDEISKAVLSLNKGIIKILSDDNGYIIGAHILGENAGELIHEIALAMKMKIKIYNIGKMLHSYPTYSDGIRMSFLKLMSKYNNINKI